MLTRFLEFMNRHLLLLLWIIIPFMAFAQRPVDRVYPWLDSAHSRWFYFSSACRPFGLVSLFPDNRTDEDWDSGYRYEVDSIQEFSHVHEWQLAGVAVMPVSFDLRDKAKLFNDYSSHFLHSKETVRPGYHSVFLEKYKLRAELTATNRVGFHRYTFQDAKQQGVIFDLGKHLGPSGISEGSFVKVNDYEIRGYVVNAPTFRRSRSATVYFSAVFNRPVKEITLQEGAGQRNGVSNFCKPIKRTFVDESGHLLHQRRGCCQKPESGSSRLEF
jgi:putative alpha-1,2-mannosidase